MKTILLALFSLIVATRAADAAPRQNVIFILADDLGWADTTLYGHTKYYRTPNIERLAKRGLVFPRAYSASPLCSPTRSAVLTGLSPARTGITTPNCHLPQVVLEATQGTKAVPGNKSVGPSSVSRLKTDYPTIARTLKQAGYATGHFGKWHLGPEPYSPLQHGFDVDVPHWPGPGPAGSFVAPWKFKDFDADPNVPDQHLEDRMAKEAVAFIERHKAETFFLNYWMFSVHAPFDAKKTLIEKYRGSVDPKDPQRCPTYAAMIESMDDAVGTLLDTVDRLGLAERTMIIFTSDNGGNMYNEVEGVPPTSNAPLRGGKATVFEGGTRVPCIVSMPGITQYGGRSDALVQSEDYFPTLVEALGLKAASGQIFDGVSLMPALRGGELKREAIFQYFPHDPKVPGWLPPSVTIHRGDWKLIRIFHAGENGAHRHMLFNLAEDLGEKNNLAAQKPELVSELDALITKFLTETKAVVPVSNPAFDQAKYQPELEGISTKDNAKPKKAPAKPAAKTGDDDPALQGWKQRGLIASVKDGILTARTQGEGSFLGLAAGKITGPATVKFRIRSATAGKAKVEWLPSPQASDKAKSVPFEIPAGDWSEQSVRLPAEGALGILRIYLPPSKGAIEIDWIELEGATGAQRSDF